MLEMPLLCSFPSSKTVTWNQTHWLLLVLFSIIIVLEYTTPPPYIFGYLYIGPLLLASSRLSHKSTIVVTVIAIMLTLFNLWIPGIEPITGVTIANRIITIIALGVTAWLSDRIQQYEKAIIKQRLQIATQNQLARVREDFISTLTHDLKTPLLGGIETLNAFQNKQFGIISEAQERVIAVMIRSHQMTLKLVETLMDVYRNDTQGLPLNLTRVNLVNIAEETILQLTLFAYSREVCLYLKHKDSDFRQAYWIQGDSFQLQRVFNNLITNAVNHSLRGSKVEIVMTGKNDSCQVEVMDEGQGIHSEDFSHLFERFYQSHSNHQTKGTGLGLYLSRQIIEAHGGKIWASQRVSQGAIFGFSLPLDTKS